MKIAIILAGGKSRRMGGDKLSLKIDGKTILQHAVDKFDVDKVVLAKGGKTRQETLRKALKNLRGNPLIIVHNGANPFVTKKEISACIRVAEKHGAAYVGHEIYDTIHDKSGKTLKRENLIKAQTPQIAYLKDLKKALALGVECTDEVELLSLIGIKAKPIPASENNFKVTTWAGYEYAKYLFGEEVSGIGHDSHPFSKTEKGLCLGGVLFPKEFKVMANSDGDVLLHATINAIQSALGEKSLGSFADKMCKKGVKDSKEYLSHALKSMAKKGLKIKEIRLSIEANQPKIDKISTKIAKNLQKLTGCKQIGITATTGNKKSNQIKCTSLVTFTSAI
jgi:2-C-methyl-D-erythritol 4-phosphate cytidylyltransferase / 2-C-methyl-D-erythritol 2,4-cyclodiphosphate synthase